VSEQRDGAVALLVRWCDLATEALAAAREEIDALNVFPVPDGDTGTNMYLTFESARQALADCDRPELAQALTVFGRGALLGARGNSGVILSQMLRAGAEQLVSGDPREPGRLLADTLSLAAAGAYAAVGEPVEGTMLTVARAAADAAQAAVPSLPAELTEQMGLVITSAADAARVALEATTEQLEALRNAGVVDAGGRALCVILDAAQLALTGRRPPPYVRPRAAPGPLAVAGADLSADGPGYEVMFLLDADDAALPTLRGRLAGLGDSLVVVGGDGLWNVHVHVDDVGAAIEAGIEAGRPHRIRVTHFAEQVAAASGEGSGDNRAPARTGRSVIAVAAGPGLAALFADAGAHVVEGGPGRRPSTGQLLEAIAGTGAQEIVILPNDPDSVRAARVAASTAESDGMGHGLRISVIPTEAQVQGLAAIAVHEPGRTFDQDVTEMTATARHVKHGAVTIAVKEAMTSAGPCQEGDVLGVIAGDFVVIGEELGQVALDILTRLLASGGELVTLVRGDGADDGAGDIADRAAAWVEEQHPHVDVVVYDGGQERYPLLMSVE
jgi:DAK2 domain fusion protein YloV